MNICDKNFKKEFRIGNATVGTVGYGFIGNAVVELFREHCRVIVYDKSGYKDKQDLQNVIKADSIDSLVRSCEVIFVAVPTPMEKDGKCHTGIVESVIQDIQNAAIKNSIDVNNFIVVIKSTVPPGFTESMKTKYALRIMFSPEFLTEANAVNDFKSATRVILGGDLEDAQVVYKYFEGVWPSRQLNTYTDHHDGPVQILNTSSTEAEITKLFTNALLASKVMISNEIYSLCQNSGADYDSVKLLTQLDKRIGFSHMNVPGPDGSLGYGGHCFVKDVQNLAYLCGQESLFKSLHERNLQLRDNRDWEEMSGRAVI